MLVLYTQPIKIVVILQKMGTELAQKQYKLKKKLSLLVLKATSFMHTKC